VEFRDEIWYLNQVFNAFAGGASGSPDSKKKKTSA
jgi:hypothetical protein